MEFRCEHREGPVWRIELRSEGDADAGLAHGALEQFEALLAQAARDKTCRVLVLEGHDGRFCRGMDLAEVMREKGDVAGGVRHYAICLRLLRQSRQAVVAVVDGAALGGGLGLAAAADVLIATERATFGLPEALVGLLPAMVLPLLCERMPAQKVRRLALAALCWDAATALRLGLVDHVVADGEAAEKALRHELRQMLRLEPKAVAELQRFTLRVSTLAPDEGINVGADVTAEAVDDKRVLAGIRAFLDGEPASWVERYRPPK